VFDRDLEIARAGARLIPASVDIVVVEGNYLLLREPPWDALKPHFDLTVMVDVPEQILASVSLPAGKATLCRPKKSPANWRRSTFPTAAS